jgi:hypothetical protein
MSDTDFGNSGLEEPLHFPEQEIERVSVFENGN